MVIGVGAAKEELRTIFERQGLDRRLHMIGTLDRKELVDACHAMDIFAFASKSETQGIVLIEAMAAGGPVVALDAPGAADVVEDGVNGRLLREEDPQAFADALASLASLSPTQRDRIKQAARRTAGRFSIQRSTEQLLDVYDRMCREEALERPIDPAPWGALLEQVKTEWELVANIAGAAAAALHSPQISTQP